MTLLWHLRVLGGLQSACLCLWLSWQLIPWLLVHPSLLSPTLCSPLSLSEFPPIWVSCSRLVSRSFSLPPCSHSCVTSISPTLSPPPSHLHPTPFHLYLNPRSLFYPHFQLYFSLYPFSVKKKKKCNLGFTVWLKSHLHIHPNLNGSTFFPPQCNVFTCFWD